MQWVISALGSGLIYQLSTAGQERFDSNSPFWLAVEAQGIWPGVGPLRIGQTHFARTG